MILEALILPIGGRILSFFWTYVSMILEALILHIDDGILSFFWNYVSMIFRSSNSPY
jgi:hypothetical protein